MVHRWGIGVGGAEWETGREIGKVWKPPEALSQKTLTPLLQQGF